MIGQHIVRIEKRFDKPMAEVGNDEFLSAWMSAFEEAEGRVRSSYPNSELEDRTPAPKLITKWNTSSEERHLWFVTVFLVTPPSRKAPTDCFRVFLDLIAPAKKKKKQGDDSDDAESTSVSR